MSSPWGNPLWKKLDIKEGYQCMFIGAPKEFFPLIIDAPLHSETSNIAEADMIFIFTNSKQELVTWIKELRSIVKPTVSVWFCWYKKASGLTSELSDNVIREEVLKTKLVDTKVCSINEQWSGLKFRVRKELR